MRFGSKLKLVCSLYQLAIYSVSSVLFDSFAPAHLALRANLRLLYLKGPAFSVVVNSAGFRPSGLFVAFFIILLWITWTRPYK